MALISNKRLSLIAIPVASLVVFFLLSAQLETLALKAGMPDASTYDMQNRIPSAAYDAAFPWNANNEFALDIYNIIKDDKDDNVFFSPTSIMIAMAMAYEGSGGNTASELEAAMGFLPDGENRAKFMHALKSLSKRNAEHTVNVANALWIKNNFTPHAEYSGILSEYYGSLIDRFDASDKSYEKINDWISDATMGKIKNVINPPTLDAATMIITNAVYFNATWDVEFLPEDTYTGDFWRGIGRSTEAEMMMQVKMTNYTSVDGMEMIQMPYKGGRYSMLVILPDGIFGMDSVEKILSTDRLSGWIDGLSPRMVDIRIPKFELETEYGLIPVLQDLGINDAFSPIRADFSKISGGSLYIYDSRQYAYVKVGEAGTEAAAMTGNLFTTADSRIFFDVQFKADHPFIFIIWDGENQSILFLGKMTNPNSPTAPK